MINIAKRIIAASLVCLLLFTSGCGGGPETTGVIEDSVPDGSGAVLKIPENRDEVTIASVYAVAVPFIVALDLSERVLAINVKSKFWTDADEHLAAAGTVGRGAVDLEALAGYEPGVLVHRSNDPETVEAVSGKLGIDVLCITVESFEDIKYTLEMMGRYFGKEARAQEVCEWLDAKFRMIDEIVAEIPGDERVTALTLGGELGRVAGGDMLQSWMIEKAGGICVAASVSENRGWVNVGAETIFGWNPEFIFCTSSTPLDYSAESLIAESAWSAVAAVVEANVYAVPTQMDSWDMPGISCAVGTMFMLNKMYPDYFSTEELEREIEEYYTFMFGKTFERSYLGYDLEK